LTLSVLRIVRFSVSERGKGALFFIDMRLKDEFSFALGEQIHRIVASTQRSNQSRTLHHLNEAHPDLDLDPFLAWRLRFIGTDVG
jgi:hypothetical protein